MDSLYRLVHAAFTLIQYGVEICIGLVLVYLCARLVFFAWFKTKNQFKEECNGSVKEGWSGDNRQEI